MVKPSIFLKLLLLYMIISSASSTNSTIASTISTTANTIIADATKLANQLTDQAKVYAEELYKNATAFAQTALVEAQKFGEQGGILGDTVKTSLQLIGLGSKYTSIDKMEKACNALTYVNHYSQCLIHRFDGYWCCAVKVIDSGALSCKNYSDKDAKALVITTTNKFKYYCSGKIINTIFGAIAIMFLFLF